MTWSYNATTKTLSHYDEVVCYDKDSLAQLISTLVYAGLVWEATTVAAEATTGGAEATTGGA